MKFQVKFKGKLKAEDGFCSADAYYTKNISLGLEHVDQLREEAGCEIQLDLITDRACYTHGDPSVVISEELARDCGHCKTTHEVEVSVPRYSLNQFVELVAEINRDKITGAVKYARYNQQLNTAKLISAWRDAGFPIEWDPTEAQ